MVGKPGCMSLEERERRRLRWLRDKNPRWKSDNLGITGLHRRIRKTLPEPKLCPLCLINSPKHLSNKIGVYNINLANWWYLCIPCHNKYDQWIDTSDRVCNFCGSSKTGTRKKKLGRRPDWRHVDGEWACSKCRTRIERERGRPHY